MDFNGFGGIQRRLLTLDARVSMWFQKKTHFVRLRSLRTDFTSDFASSVSGSNIRERVQP